MKFCLWKSNWFLQQQGCQSLTSHVYVQLFIPLFSSITLALIQIKSFHVCIFCSFCFLFASSSSCLFVFPICLIVCCFCICVSLFCLLYNFCQLQYLMGFLHFCNFATGLHNKEQQFDTSSTNTKVLFCVVWPFFENCEHPYNDQYFSGVFSTFFVDLVWNYLKELTSA